MSNATPQEQNREVSQAAAAAARLLKFLNPKLQNLLAAHSSVRYS
jgi:hypothetical protein